MNAIRSYTSSSRQINRFVGLLLIITALFWIAWKFIQNRGIVPRLALSPRKTFALLGFIVLAQTAITAIAFRLTEFTALQNVKAPMNDPTLWAFAIPFATGSLLMTLLADRPTALFANAKCFDIRIYGTKGAGIRRIRGDRLLGGGVRHRALQEPADGDYCGRADRPR